MPVFVASTTTFDLQSQPTLPLPITVVTNTSHTAPSPVECISLDDFGYTLSTPRSHESRLDPSATEVLPPYIEDLPPSYSLKAPEPVTLAEYLFKFGFLFPPFWILGSWILCSPLHPPSNDLDTEGAWMADKTESERQHVIAEIRNAEVRWALRCLWAFLILILLGVIAATVAWVVLHS